jgi:lon-related putative ATP-dependent protease
MECDRVSDRFRLDPTRLRWMCDCTKLGFQTTDQLPDLTETIGQDRAVAALDFGIRMQSDGYNIFVLGPVGTGRTSMSRAMLEEMAASQPTPGDWVYVHNFAQPNQPRAIGLASGKACQLRDDLRELVEDVRRELATAFESEEYIDRREEAIREFREERQAELEAFEKEAQEAGMVVGRGPAGIVVAPAKNGEVMSPQEYAELPEEERKAIDRRREELQDKLEEILRKHHRKEKAARAQVRKLDQEVARFAIGHLFEELRARYADNPAVIDHLRTIENDIIENVDALRARDEEGPSFPLPFAMPQAESRYNLYGVNVLLSHSGSEGAPVVFEPNPTIDNLTGFVEHRTHMGALVTDYTMVRPGALHRANGGYLLLEAETLLRKPFAWEALKRALKNRSVRVESLADQLRFLSTVTLEPEPIPLNVKVVLVGTPYVYYLLDAYDDDFRKLFKVKADCDTSTRRTPKALRQYARFVATCARREGLPPFDASAVARILEHAARVAGDQLRLTTRFVEIADLVREAAHWCVRSGNSCVTAADVERALQEHVRRSNRVEERMLEMVERGFQIIDVDGEAVGQINGLAVVPLGDYWFGRPSRVTARTYVGRGGVTQIDREAKLTGRIHDKGVLILSGFLHDRFGRDRPLTLAASLTFEQSYEVIEGDSASSAELYAILSSLADAPIRQGIAVTGSVNQLGEIQAIGGVNEKIEGFFKTCKTRGLTGEQGVIIPAANVPNLMLSNEVVQAVREGKFHIYAVKTVDQGMEILTGLKAGRRGRDGRFPPDTINGRVQATLDRFAAAYDGRTNDANDGHSDGDGNGEPRAKQKARPRKR